LAERPVPNTNTIIIDFFWKFIVGQEGKTLDLTRTDGGNWTGGAVGLGVLRGSQFGISAARYPQLDIAALTENDAEVLFIHDYFIQFGCDRLPQGLALLVCDAAYNGGDPIAWMQAAVGAPVDHRFGPETESAAKAAMDADPLTVLAAFQALHLAYLTNLRLWPIDGAALGRPLGWATRLNIALAHAVSLAITPLPVTAG
jgi:lysozyme family protein